MVTLIQIIAIFVLVIIFEIITIVGRTIFHKNSVLIQHGLGIPRLHHSYLGGVMLIFYFFWPWSWFLIIGAALIISDLVHHWVVIPFLKINKYDLGLSSHPPFHAKTSKTIKKLIAITLVALGSIALATPLTPGSWLLPLGLIMLVGKEKTKTIFEKIFGKRIARKLIKDD